MWQTLGSNDVNPRFWRWLQFPKGSKVSLGRGERSNLTISGTASSMSWRFQWDTRQKLDPIMCWWAGWFDTAHGLLTSSKWRVPWERLICSIRGKEHAADTNIPTKGWVGQWQTCKKSFATEHFGQVRTQCRVPRKFWNWAAHWGMLSKNWTRNVGPGWCNWKWHWWRNCRSPRCKFEKEENDEPDVNPGGASSWTADTPKRRESGHPVRMRVHWRVVFRQSTIFGVTCQLSTSAEIALHWVENSRKMNWRPVESSSCKTWFLTHKDWWYDLPPRKYAYDMDWVDEWRGDRVRPQLCVRQNAEGLLDDLFAGTPDTFFSSCICWQRQQVARTLESLSSTFLLHLCMFEQMCFQVVQQLNNLGLISMNKLSTLENVAEMITKHVPWGVLDKLAGLMGYSFTVEENAKF